jgi:hypothetical protein
MTIHFLASCPLVSFVSFVVNLWFSANLWFAA